MSEKYALATFSSQNGPKKVGVVMGDRIAPLGDLLDLLDDNSLDFARNGCMLDLLENWAAALPALNALASAAAQRSDVPWLNVGEVRFHPPVDLPRQIFCTGANYRTHVVDIMMDSGSAPENLSGQEARKWLENMMDERLAEGDPYVFTVPVAAISGAHDDLVIPKTTTKLDWELELAVIIGMHGYQISCDDAMDYVAGYAIVNDISARDLIERKDWPVLSPDWFRTKGGKGFKPFGPYLVPAQFIPDPYKLGIRLSVEGKLMQNETTADMMFSIARQIEYISRHTPLMPGDIICTGSPAGNGTHYNRFLQDGDLMVGELDGLGAQHIHCVAAKD